MAVMARERKDGTVSSRNLDAGFLIRTCALGQGQPLYTWVNKHLGVCLFVWGGWQRHRRAHHQLTP